MQQENTGGPCSIYNLIGFCTGCALEHQPSQKDYFDSDVSLYWCTDINQRLPNTLQILVIN